MLCHVGRVLEVGGSQGSAVAMRCALLTFVGTYTVFEIDEPAGGFSPKRR
jgi:hypothetical protein